MEIVDPMLRPKMRHTIVETDSSTVEVGTSCYRVLYTSKLGIACNKYTTRQLAKVANYVPDVTNLPGFILQRFNDVSADECGSRKKSSTATLGAPEQAVQSTQNIPLTLDMAKALFDPDYVATLKDFLDAESGVAMGSTAVLEERYAEKPAVYYKLAVSNDSSTAGRGRGRGGRVRKPPANIPADGKLAVSTIFSNYNLVRNKFSNERSPFADDDGNGQLLGQITMRETAALPNAAPVLHFSVPASELLAFMQDEGARNLIKLYSEPRGGADGEQQQPQQHSAGSTSASDSEN